MPNFENGYKGGNTKSDWSSGSRKNHKEFRKQHPELKVTELLFSQIIRRLNEEYIIHALETGDNIKLPYNFGHLWVSKQKLSKTGYKGKAPVDWNETLKQGKRVELINWHTEGYRCKWNWGRYTSGQSLSLVVIWELKMIKKASLLLRDYLNNREENYLQKYQHRI